MFQKRAAGSALETYAMGPVALAVHGVVSRGGGVLNASDTRLEAKKRSIPLCRVLWFISQ